MCVHVCVHALLFMCVQISSAYATEDAAVKIIPYKLAGLFSRARIHSAYSLLFKAIPTAPPYSWRSLTIPLRSGGAGPRRQVRWAGSGRGRLFVAAGAALPPAHPPPVPPLGRPFGRPRPAERPLRPGGRRGAGRCRRADGAVPPGSLSLPLGMRHGRGARSPASHHRLHVATPAERAARHPAGSGEPRGARGGLGVRGPAPCPQGGPAAARCGAGARLPLFCGGTPRFCGGAPAGGCCWGCCGAQRELSRCREVCNADSAARAAQVLPNAFLRRAGALGAAFEDAAVGRRYSSLFWRRASA